MKKVTTTWVLVADASRARLFEALGWEKGLKLLEEASQDMQQTSEIGTERPGRAFESADTARHAMEPRIDWHRQQKDTFARTIADRLHRRVATDHPDALVLVAPPQFLGDLRAHLANDVASKITGEAPKDYAHLPEHDLPVHLRDYAPC